MGDVADITALRENIIRNVRDDFIDALNQWINGNEIPLAERYPGAYYLLVMSDIEIFRMAIEKSIALRKEAAEKTVEDLGKMQIETSFALDKSIASTRPFDIIARYNDLLKVEYSMIEQGILDQNKQFIPNRPRCNKRCLAGVYKLLIKNGYFKKFGPGKNQKNKRISRSDIYRFLNHRYGIKSFQELSRTGNSEEIAITRLPFLANKL